MALLGSIVVLAIFVFVQNGEAKEQILGTGLWTDTQYQIHDNLRSGFNLLTYADVKPKSGVKFVQLDDHADRELKYARGGEWFEDGLWTFKHENEVEGHVTIHHVKYPDLRLVVNADLESPQGSVPAKHYLMLTNDPTYVDQGNDLALKRQNGFWDLRTREDDSLQIHNLGDGNVVAVSPRSSENDYYQWVTTTDEESSTFNFRINAV